MYESICPHHGHLWMCVSLHVCKNFCTLFHGVRHFCYRDLGCRVNVRDMGYPVYSRDLKDWASRYLYIAGKGFAWATPFSGCWAAG